MPSPPGQWSVMVQVEIDGTPVADFGPAVACLTSGPQRRRGPDGDPLLAPRKRPASRKRRRQASTRGAAITEIGGAHVDALDDSVLITGGTVVDAGGERRGDVLVEGDRIIAVADRLDRPAGARVIDAEGCLVGPALVDLHTHLREPGGERAETVESGARAAAAGGYGAIVAMPNTIPAIDSATVVRDVLELGRRAVVEVAVAGAITIGRAGEQLVPFAEMAALMASGLFTDDVTRGIPARGVDAAGARVRRRLLGVQSLAEHCEDEEISGGGHMHEGAWSSRLGIPAQPGLAEEEMLKRATSRLRPTSPCAPMHFLHLSTAGSIAPGWLSKAKAEGLPVTAAGRRPASTSLMLTDAEIESYDARFKVNPPLRTDADVAAVLPGGRRPRGRSGRHRDRPPPPPTLPRRRMRRSNRPRSA